MMPLMALSGRDGGSGTGEDLPETGALLAPLAISFSERKLACTRHCKIKGKW